MDTSSLSAIPTSASFVDSIGTGWDFNNPSDATWAADTLKYLGIGHVRTDYATAENLLTAGSEGAKMDFIIPWFMYGITNKTIDALLSTVLNPAASVIEAVEGPNELNDDPDTFNGVGGPDGFIALQKYIYASVKADPALNKAAVYNFSLLQGTTMSDYTASGNDSGSLADYNNVHAYGGPGIPSGWIFPYELANNKLAGTDKPTVMTEVGQTTIANEQGVSETVQARYDIQALLEGYKLGAARTYLFNLRDWNTPTDTSNFSAHYGLYNLDGTPKLAAAAIHDFTTILGTGNTAASSLDTAPDYAVDGMPYYGQKLLLAKGDSRFDLAVWTDRNYWNQGTHSEDSLDVSRVTVTFGSVMEARVYNPMVSSDPVSTSTGRTVTIELSKDPLIVEFGPAEPAVAAPVVTIPVVLAPVPSPTPVPVVTSAPPVSNSPVSAQTTHPDHIEPVEVEEHAPVVSLPISLQTTTPTATTTATVMESSTHAEPSHENTASRTPVTASMLYRFFDKVTGTHFFTSSASEAAEIQDVHGAAYRDDLILEHNTFGTISASNVADSNVITINRLFDKSNGTHFFTASTQEMTSLVTPGTSSYRPDMVYEKAGEFFAHTAMVAGDTAVYRFFDTTNGTHFFSGSADEAQALSTPGAAGYSSHMVAEGIAFYAPRM